MAIRNDYRVSGMSTADVRALQQSLGVKADGAWGPKSQAALDAKYGSGADPYSVYSGSGSSQSGAYSSGAGSYSPTASSGAYSGSGYSSGAATTGLYNNADIVSYRQGHPSGYSGNYYTDSRGKSYTEDGALLRTDGFFYPEGAKVSPNGMYYDVGNGWQYAKGSKTSDGYYVANSMTGRAPGSIDYSFDETGINGGFAQKRAAGHVAGGQSDSGNGGNNNTGSSANREKWQDDFDEEIQRYMKRLFGGYGLV